MFTNLVNNHKLLLFLLFIFTITSITLKAQPQGQDICDNGDCPEAVYTIDLDLPLDINEDKYQDRRLDLYKAAYQKLKTLEATNASDAEKQKNYKEGIVGGSNCIRMYHIKALMVHEYDQSPLFKAYIEQNEVNLDTFQWHGFKASTHALSLMTRMKNRCNRQVTKLDEKPGPKLKDLPFTFQKLAIMLGFFDKFDPNENAELLAYAASKLKEQLNLTPDIPTLQGNLKELKAAHEAIQQRLKQAGGVQNELKVSLDNKIKNPIINVPEALKTEFEQLNQNLYAHQADVSNKGTSLSGLETELNGLIKEKVDLETQINNPTADNIQQLKVQVDDYVKRYTTFPNKISQQITANATVLSNLTNFAIAQEEFRKKLDQLEFDARDAALRAEEERLKKEFGETVKLEPVAVEEWKEGFQVERTYWDAVYHPDKELVKGFKGRYFEISLKDANKNVKVLFDVGKYYMDKKDFRKKYGRTMGTFVAEAMHHFKKGAEGQVKVFIQGSADNLGNNSFKGKMDERYQFTEVKVLPQNSDGETFSGQPTVKLIPPSSFRNNHLPDLRGQYLKNMIAQYTEKFNPILLEGTVTSNQGEEERNAVIYLFFPDELLSGTR